IAPHTLATRTRRRVCAVACEVDEPLPGLGFPPQLIPQQGFPALLRSARAGRATSASVLLGSRADDPSAPSTTQHGWHDTPRNGCKIACQGSAKGEIARVGTGTKVLVVDDEVNERQGLAELLQAWGHEVETAPDGQQALEKISSFNPVLVVSDLRMPVMGGMDLLKQVRETRPGINFIMLTGHASIDEAVEATKLGAFNFLEKPLNPQRLQVELRNCLERQESERQLEVARRRLRDLGFLGSLV